MTPLFPSHDATLPFSRRRSSRQGERFHFNALVSDDDLELTYLPAWKALSDAGALGGVMSAISGLNGIPSVAHKQMLTNVLRGEWGFDGHVISDCDTVSSVHEAFHYTAGMQQSVAIALSRQ